MRNVRCFSWENLCSSPFYLLITLFVVLPEKVKKCHDGYEYCHNFLNLWSTYFWIRCLIDCLLVLLIDCLLLWLADCLIVWLFTCLIDCLITWLIVLLVWLHDWLFTRLIDFLMSHLIKQPIKQVNNYNIYINLITGFEHIPFNLPSNQLAWEDQMLNFSICVFNFNLTRLTSVTLHLVSAPI